jgi:hypothetical protein
VTDLVQFHLQRLDTLRGDRGNWDAQWEESAARVIPSHRNLFFSRGSSAMSPGQKKTELMYDATAALANMRFGAVIESLSTPQSGIWHRLVPVDKVLKRNRAVRLFFDEVTELLFSYRYRPVANFVANSQQVYNSLGAYGNGILFVDAPDDTKGLRYRNIHLGEAYFVQNHAGIVDTLYRAYWMTARQAVQMFGDAVSDQIKTAAGNAAQTETKYEFAHCVYPRGSYLPGAIRGEDMRFASIYIEVGQKIKVRESGYASFPYPVSRYTQASGEEYGRGPAQWVLPSIKILNEQKKTALKQGHRVVDPVLLAFDDGTVDGFSLRAGAINKGGVNAEGRALVQPLPVGNIAIGDKMMEIERQIINDAFLITLFQILTDTPQMTATEVLERAREKGMLVAPTAGRMQAEFLGPLIERELDLLDQQGLLPPMPPILAEAGGAYKIEYDSPMSRMQRAEKASGFMRALGVAAEYAKNTMDPSPLDWFNFDTAMPEIIDIHGAPVAWTRTLDDVKAVRDQRNEQAQQKMMLENAAGVGAAAKALPELQKASGGQ